MTDDQRRPGAVTHGGERRRRAASQRGAATIKKAFSEVLTRRVFAERVGIHPTTLRRWEALGIVEPQRTAVRGIPTLVFDEDDVERGRAIAELLRRHAGTLSVQDAAVMAEERRRGGSRTA